MNNHITELGFDLQDTWVIHVLVLFFDMSSMGYGTTRHLRTFGRLVLELNSCTVSIGSCSYLCI